jgi:hypothetical protein
MLVMLSGMYCPCLWCVWDVLYLLVMCLGCTLYLPACDVSEITLSLHVMCLECFVPVCSFSTRTVLPSCGACGVRGESLRFKNLNDS